MQDCPPPATEQPVTSAFAAQPVYVTHVVSPALAGLVAGAESYGESWSESTVPIRPKIDRWSQGITTITAGDTGSE